MKKITMVIGSMRKGNSAYIAGEITKAFPEISAFTLGHNVNYCTGCLKCDETHKCVIRDDMDEILESIIASDVLLIITPVRYSLMSGDVKVFIDRLNPTAVAESICGKELLAIAIGQTEEQDGTVQDALKSLEMFAHNADLTYLDGFPIYTCYGENELADKPDVVADVINWIRGYI